MVERPSTGIGEVAQRKLARARNPAAEYNVCLSGLVVIAHEQRHPREARMPRRVESATEEASSETGALHRRRDDDLGEVRRAFTEI